LAKVLTKLRPKIAEFPGRCFPDADLIGLPVRVTVIEQALIQGWEELKLRSKPD